MYRKDYIDRQFEEFGKFLAKILRARAEKDWQLFESEIESALMRFTDHQLKEVEAMDISEFKLSVISNDKLSSAQLKILARLLFERLEQCLLTESGNAALQAEKCGLLYEKALQDLSGSEFDLDIHYRIGFLNKLRSL